MLLSKNSFEKNSRQKINLPGTKGINKGISSLNPAIPYPISDSLLMFAFPSTLDDRLRSRVLRKNSGINPIILNLFRPNRKQSHYRREVGTLSETRWRCMYVQATESQTSGGEARQLCAPPPLCVSSPAVLACSSLSFAPFCSSD